MQKKYLCGLLLFIISALAQSEDKITLFAAASLTDALTEISESYEKENKLSVQTSFASSSVLAKQIEKGAPADIFIAADSKWMKYLQDKNLIQSDSKRDLLGNNLVLIAPKGKEFKVQANKSFKLAAAFAGRLCTGETESVPAGIYAKQALTSLNWWESIKTRVVGTQDVRAALVFVERGECEAGIVYGTDAKVSDKVSVLSVLPESSHEAIVYPLALIKGANQQAKGFYQYLISEKAKAIFTKYGFVVL